MKLEEQESRENEESNGVEPMGNISGGKGGGSDGRPRKLLKDKIIDILGALGGNAIDTAPATEQAGMNLLDALDMSIPSPTSTGRLQDLDVLPVLYNDPSYNIWQFLDFDPPLQPPTGNGFFSATADLHPLVE